MSLTHCRLTFEQVQGLLCKFREVESPYLRDFLRALFLEELCCDWLEMRAAQAEEVTPAKSPAGAGEAPEIEQGG